MNVSPSVPDQAYHHLDILDMDTRIIISIATSMGSEFNDDRLLHYMKYSFDPSLLFYLYALLPFSSLLCVISLKYDLWPNAAMENRSTLSLQ